MRISTSFFRPENLCELRDAISVFDGQIQYIAGGTDLVLNLEKTSPDLLIDVSRLPELSYINVTGSGVNIGAATTFNMINSHPDLPRILSAVIDAGAQIGSKQIRNRATLGGNIASAVPGGDMLPVLNCLDCEIDVLRKTGDIEKIAFNQIIRAQGATYLANGDLLTNVHFPLRSVENRVSAFAKIGPRETLTIARLNASVAATYDAATNWVSDITIVLGAIGPKPHRLWEANAFLSNRPFDEHFVQDFIAALENGIDHAIQGRASHPFKRSVVKGLSRDLLQSLVGPTVSEEAI